MIGDNPNWKLHDIAAHRHDRAGGWPSCDRCIDICVTFHDEHGIGHLVPLSLRRRLTEIAEAQALLNDPQSAA